MRGLYAIVDVEALALRGLDPTAFAERVLLARPAALQLRDKRGGALRTLELLRAMAPLAARAGVPFFANDRPDLALLAGCDGVHLGQDDLPVREASALVERAGVKLRIGLSTHDAAQVEEACTELAGALDYLAIGPVFPTASKARPAEVLGLDGLARLAARARALCPRLPIVAIGGITLETAASVGTVADCVAVIGALVTGDEDAIQARAEALHSVTRGRS